MNDSTIVNERDAQGEIVAALDRLRDGGMERLTVISDSGGGWGHGIPRLITVLEGERTYHGMADGVGQRITIRPGEVCFVFPNALFEPDPDDSSPSVMLSVVYYPDYIRGLILHCPRDGGRKPGDCYYHAAGGMDRFGNDLLALFGKVPPSLEDDDAVMIPLMRSLLQLTIRMIIRNAAVTWPSRSHAVWQEMNRYVVDHFEEPLSREELARLFQVTPNYVSNLFKRFSGRSFAVCCMNYRLERAAAMLAGSRLPVKEVGRICGYDHTSYFIRCFRRRYGLTPAEYRVRERTSDGSGDEPGHD